MHVTTLQIITLSISLAVSGVLALPVTASVMQGDVYGVSEDALDVAGGLQSSERYRAVDSSGLVGAGSGESENFGSEQGYAPHLDPIVLSLSGLSSVVMDTPLGGLSGGESNGSSTVTIATNNPHGYQLFIAAEGAPAMRSADATLSDYTPNTTAPDVDFRTTAEDAHFGFSVFGTDAVADFQHNGTECGVGSNTRGFCWQGLSTSTQLIATNNSGNYPNGTGIEILYRVGIGSNTTQLPGTYVATTTITALPL